MTKMANAFFKGGDHRVYVDSAPHFVANAALTLSAWRGLERFTPHASDQPLSFGR
jgi:hypothetical protein